MTDQLLAIATGTLLLTAVLLLWRRTVSGAAVLVGVQGLALAVLAAVTAATEGHPELFAGAALFVVIKGLLIPVLIMRTARVVDAGAEATPLVNPTTGMLLAAGLTTVAFLVSRPLTGAGGTTLAAAVPVGIAVVLIGFLVLATRRQALAQIIGFVMVDNGIGATALLASGGLPLVIELGVLLDVLLVVLILLVLTRRIGAAFGTTELHELSELRD
jgi:hydrogenase-4 component E